MAAPQTPVEATSLSHEIRRPPSASNFEPPLTEPATGEEIEPVMESIDPGRALQQSATGSSVSPLDVFGLMDRRFASL